MKQLAKIQTELKAPKDKKNKFGGYNYRSCEGILEAVKPLLAKHKVTLTLSDEMVALEGRVYVRATATVENEEGVARCVSAFAREATTKKGMDDAQITGAASSYARKYALNGLFCIDDTKDMDTEEYSNHGRNAGSSKPEPKKKYFYDLAILHEDVIGPALTYVIDNKGDNIASTLYVSERKLAKLNNCEVSEAKAKELAEHYSGRTS